jgi:hypothetical protein
MISTIERDPLGPQVRDAHRSMGVAAAAIVVLFALGQPAAALANSLHLQMIVGGATVLDETAGPTSATVSKEASPAGANYTGKLSGRAFQGGDVGASASIHGTVSAHAQVTAKGTPSFQLTQPAGANVAGGKLVLHTVLSGEVTGNASMELELKVDLLSDAGTTTASGSRTLTDQPGREQVEFDVAVALPATIELGDIFLVRPELTLNVIAGITPSNGQVASATADALDSGKLTGFRVLNAAGVQVTGFTLVGSGKSIPELATPPVGKALAVEYYHEAFRHYFITADADEIGKLDAGILSGWQRTGYSFSVYTTAAPNLAPVCRFFTTSFPPKSSHFYAPRGLGCEPVLSNPAWQYEGDVFFTALPDASGACPAGNVPVYRLYNDGMGGAPNHRFTTSETVQLDMIGAGYVREGNGNGVGMCSPL